MSKETKEAEIVQTMRRGSDTPFPVGRRIASLIPPAHIVASLALACVLGGGIWGASWGRLGASWGPPEGLLGASWGLLGASCGLLGAS